MSESEFYLVLASSAAAYAIGDMVGAISGREACAKVCEDTAMYCETKAQGGRHEMRT